MVARALGRGSGFLFRSLVLVTLWTMLSGSPILAQISTDRFDSPMYHDPEYRPPVFERFFPDGIDDLWYQALAQSETEVQIKAADAFAKAHEMGMEVGDELGPVLLKIFRDESTHPLARQATARALIQIDHKEAADAFHATVRTEPLSLVQIVEPALAKWQHEPTVEVWRERLGDANVPTEHLVLAIRGVAEANDLESVERLSELVSSRESPIRSRLIAANALARLTPDNNDALATRLLESDDATPVSRLIAVRLIESTTAPSSIELLLRFAADDDPSIALIAQEAIWRLEPERLFPIVDQMRQSRDPNIRQLATHVLGKQRDQEAAAKLITLFDDRHPLVRTDAREEIEAFLAANQHAVEIWTQVGSILIADNPATNWRALEQAMLLVGHTDHKDLAPELIRHLRGQRIEVKVTAAWALRLLNVESTYPATLAYCQSLYDNRESIPITMLEDEQLGHLFQMYGLAEYAAAEPLMRSFIPKDMSLGLASRLGALWGLGYLHEDEPDEELGRLIVARLNDRDSLEPEPPAVRRMCANALGRMLCESQLESLRDSVRFDDVRTSTGFTSAWAIHRITGEPLPEPVTLLRKAGTWFLEPLQN